MMLLIFSSVNSTSSFVLNLLNEKRTDWQSSWCGNSANTWDPWLDPDENALPPDAAIPWISKLNNNIELQTSAGKHTLRTVYKLFSGLVSPLNLILVRQS